MGDPELVRTTEATSDLAGCWADYLRPLRFDHWIKNLVVLAGSTLALAAHRIIPDWGVVGTACLAFLISGFVSSVNYAINEVLDARFDAQHPVKRERPIPSGRVRVGPLLVLTAVIALTTFAGATWLFPPAFVLANLALFLAGLLYNVPPIRLKDWPYLDALVESLTNPIRLSIGWCAVSPTNLVTPPILLLLTVWGFGAFLMTGKRLAELRLLGSRAARYRQTFRAYSVRTLFLVQLGYAVVSMLTLAWLLAAERPALLRFLPVVAVMLAWTFKMTLERESPLIDPEHLYRRPVFLIFSLALFAGMVAWAVW